MKVQKKDLIATGLVAIAGAVYLLWVVGGVLPADLDGVRPAGIVIMALGFVASAIAVVPSFDRLLHGNKAYLLVTSLVGLLAVVAGIRMLVDESGTGLTIVMSAMVVLWLTATIHHSLLAKDDADRGRREGAAGVGTRARTRR